ncbi:type II 3-dehydroquinate dehydratase [Humidisolicoccus flavus]|uniref:type II 3-dehydroquinate dehydratase n=1 Tax=Humidisolicoccus flavus TaxID=3111414 RepID=UPI003244DCBF
MTASTILVLNGPNLNLLGTRQPEVYGSEGLDDVASLLEEHAAATGVRLEHFQSNVEGELINRIHDARGSVDGIIANLGAFTHTSIAIRDAFLSVSIPVVEVHISNVHAREAFRHQSYISDIAQAVIVGAGIRGYVYALDVLSRGAE